jgi:hypothetical protein
MYLLTFAAIAVLLNTFMKRIKVYKQGQSVDWLDQLPTRILNLAKSVLLQSKVVRVKGPGLTTVPAKYSSALKSLDFFTIKNHAEA